MLREREQILADQNMQKETQLTERLNNTRASLIRFVRMQSKVPPPDLFFDFKGREEMEI